MAIAIKLIIIEPQKSWDQTFRWWSCFCCINIPDSIITETVDFTVIFATVISTWI